MGRDKALLPFRGTTLIEHALAAARGVTGDVRILSGPRRRYEGLGAPVLEDAICGAGPFGGLYTALLAASMDGTEAMFWIAVDLPLVPGDVLVRLLAELENHDVAMARTARGLEPLCAAFRTGPSLDAVRRALLEGRLKLTTALEGLSLQAIDVDERSFANVNSPAEYERLRNV